MNFSTQTNNKELASVTLACGTDVELELPIAVDSIMTYKEALQHQVGDKLIIGYLAHDDDTSSPLEDEGYGHIYEGRRHGSTLSEFLEAIGFDSYGEPTETGPHKYAVRLDVYEHGGVSYSLSGQGMQCQFDTARGGAVWVPNETCEHEIKRRGPVYQKGKIISTTLRTKHQYNVRTYQEFGVFDKVVHPPFETWSEAFKYLEELKWEGYTQPLEDGEDDAARELAKQAAEVYTEWCNGNNFGWVVASYIIPEDVEDGHEITYEEHDSCWGYTGDDNAYSALKEEFDARQQSL